MGRPGDPTAHANDLHLEWTTTEHDRLEGQTLVETHTEADGRGADRHRDVTISDDARLHLHATESAKSLEAATATELDRVHLHHQRVQEEMIYPGMTCSEESPRGHIETSETFAMKGTT